MNRRGLIEAIVEAVSSTAKKVTLTKRIGKDLWITDTKRMLALAKKRKKK